LVVSVVMEGGFLAPDSKFYRCPDCGAVMVTGADQPNMEVVEIHYYVRADMQKMICERHVCPADR
jgi:hypothetical protein